MSACLQIVFHVRPMSLRFWAFGRIGITARQSSRMGFNARFPSGFGRCLSMTSEWPRKASQSRQASETAAVTTISTLQAFPRPTCTMALTGGWSAGTHASQSSLRTLASLMSAM